MSQEFFGIQDIQLWDEKVKIWDQGVDSSIEGHPEVHVDLWVKKEPSDPGFEVRLTYREVAAIYRHLRKSQDIADDLYAQQEGV